MKREPVVAGYFYPGKRETLLTNLRELIIFEDLKISALGIVVPHAGYVYSGKVAGKVYGRIEPPDTAIILGPNHTGLGCRVALFPEGSFLTPLGETPIDRDLLLLITEETPFTTLDVLAHLKEHSLEVQVPFLQFLNPEIKIVALTLRDLALEEIRKIGEGLSKAINRYKEISGKNVLLIASSDFSHYEPHTEAQNKDRLAIEAILKLSERELLEVVSRERISMCGVFPVAVLLVTCKSLGAKEAHLIEYKTSGDITGDYYSVVGYAGIIIQ
ncbi:MAG: AmmeMemoRadiSam system protein B [Caldimicrobium sp.]|nr:AmmeMemoRadiSam system protein B [Caldimicrobium sp.]MCX7874409.1 AmmeMemoRadiSam system protein B [Caldimicrobium sp.]MDW8094006.1 AmmeMemoRadiSam system protein B [Caldimicrobium sp.]